MQLYVSNEDFSEIRSEPDMLVWGAWFETANRSVACTEVGNYQVLTVFVGLDLSCGDGPPVLFETLVFVGGAPSSENRFGRCATDDVRRYATVENARREHTRIVDQLHRELEFRVQLELRKMDPDS